MFYEKCAGDRCFFDRCRQTFLTFWPFLSSYLGCCSYAALQRRPEAAAVRLHSLDAAKSEKEYETRKSRRKGLLGLWGLKRAPKSQNS